MFDEFKKFISRGNAIDLAVGIVIGGAFQKIVTSLVEDLIMPPLGMVIGGVAFADLKIVLSPAFLNDKGIEVAEVAFKYGNFIQMLFNFLIIAFSLFLVIKVFNKLKDVNLNKKIRADLLSKAGIKIFKENDKVILTENGTEVSEVSETTASETMGNVSSETNELLKEIRDLLKR